MDDRLKPYIHRRDLLHVLAVSAATVGAVKLAGAAPRASNPAEPRRARYRADSPEVQTFYRVNRYPAK
jgi:hypothetical protein